MGKKEIKKPKNWPVGADGQSVRPVFLTHVFGDPVEMELTLNLLGAYEIPYVCSYPNNGLFGKLILGFPPGGADVFVPETVLEDAQNILSADVMDADDELFDSEIDG